MTLNTHGDTTALRQKTGTAAEERDKAAVCEALDALINMRDYVAAQRSWSPGDAIEDEAIREDTKSGLPMFKDEFPSWPRCRHPAHHVPHIVPSPLRETTHHDQPR
jgi:hypothetical protein